MKPEEFESSAGITIHVVPVGTQWAWRVSGARAPFSSGSFPHKPAALRNVFKSIEMLSALAGADASDLAEPLRASARSTPRPRGALLSPRELADLAEIDRLLDESCTALSEGVESPWYSHEGRVIVDLGTAVERAGDPADQDLPAARITIYAQKMGRGDSHPFPSTTAALGAVRAWHARATGGGDPARHDPEIDLLDEDPWF